MRVQSGILQAIARERESYRAREEQEILEAAATGSAVSPGRPAELPIIPYFSGMHTGLICEFKRASPSKGDINTDENFTTIIAEYRSGGAERFSVLTERTRFKGDWRYLSDLKRQEPTCGFLRKDFLVTPRDIYLSWVMGADAVLLIMELLGAERIAEMIREAHAYGLQTLCEVHSESSLRGLLACGERPDAIGINARDLDTFRVDPRTPFVLRYQIPEDIPVVAESGIRSPAIARLAGEAGFSSLLIGETFMRAGSAPGGRSSLVALYRESLEMGWTYRSQGGRERLVLRLLREYARTERLRSDGERRPLVKICGMTRPSDARAACDLGADAIGVVLAPSRRQVPFEELGRFAALPVPLIAVVVDPDAAMVERLRQGIQQGVIDGIQFHGMESPDLVMSFAGDGYKAVSLSPDDTDPAEGIEEAIQAFGPLTLFDIAKVGDLNDSDGRTFSETLAGEPSLHPGLSPLYRAWIAGGISTGTVRRTIERFAPILIDCSSGVESSPGMKDVQAMAEMFHEITRGV